MCDTVKLTLEITFEDPIDDDPGSEDMQELSSNLIDALVRQMGMDSLAPENTHTTAIRVFKGSTRIGIWEE